MRVDDDAPPDDCRVGTETSLPEVMAQQDDGMGVRYAVILRQQRSAERGRHTERPEVVARDDARANAVARATHAQMCGGTGIRRDVTHAARGGAIVEEVG